ncbi:hypothetical protein ES703_45878 [subsurface metagenome]
MEKRESAREELNVAVQISIDDKNTGCTLINISVAGALLRTDPRYQNDITDEDLGEEAIFILNHPSLSKREYTGEIIRMFYKGDEKYFALRFWEKYKELTG